MIARRRLVLGTIRTSQRLECVRRELDAELRRQADAGPVFVAAILAWNAVHWQFDVVETFFAHRGHAVASTDEYDRWAADARMAQAKFGDRAVAAQERLDNEQRTSGITETERRWHAVVRTMSGAFQERFERSKPTQG
jgi:hypothetical protein